MTMISTPPAVSLEKLTKRFGSLTAVDSISLEIESGQIYGILGPNGAGKSTTIKMITGLLKPDTGSIKVYGQGISQGAAIMNIGLCPQDIVVWDNLTLMEQMIFIGGMYDIPKLDARTRALELLSAMGLIEKKDKLASTLSGGMKRRLNILLALMHDPAILILDEPQAGLDPQSRVLVRDYIQSIARQKTVIITTHDMEEADKLADKVAIIDNGRILVEDTPKNLKKLAFKGDIVEILLNDDKEPDRELESGLRQLFDTFSLNGSMIRIVSANPLEAVRRINELCTALGLSTKDVKMHGGTLEDVFIQMTGRGLRE